MRAAVIFLSFVGVVVFALLAAGALKNAWGGDVPASTYVPLSVLWLVFAAGCLAALVFSFRRR